MNPREEGTRERSRSTVGLSAMLLPVDEQAWSGASWCRKVIFYVPANTQIGNRIGTERQAWEEERKCRGTLAGHHRASPGLPDGKPSGVLVYNWGALDPTSRAGEVTRKASGIREKEREREIGIGVLEWEDEMKP